MEEQNRRISMRREKIWKKRPRIGIDLSSLTVGGRYKGIDERSGGISLPQSIGIKTFHWGIENGLHWRLDVTFREDESRIRRGERRDTVLCEREFEDQCRKKLVQHFNSPRFEEEAKKCRPRMRPGRAPVLRAGPGAVGCHPEAGHELRGDAEQGVRGAGGAEQRAGRRPRRYRLQRQRKLGDARNRHRARAPGSALGARPHGRA